MSNSEESASEKLRQLQEQFERLGEISQFETSADKKKYKQEYQSLEQKIKQYQAFLELAEGQGY